MILFHPPFCPLVPAPGNDSAYPHFLCDILPCEAIKNPQLKGLSFLGLENPKHIHRLNGFHLRLHCVGLTSTTTLPRWSVNSLKSMACSSPQEQHLHGPSRPCNPDPLSILGMVELALHSFSFRLYTINAPTKRTTHSIDLPAKIAVRERIPITKQDMNLSFIPSPASCRQYTTAACHS